LNESPYIKIAGFTGKLFTRHFGNKGTKVLSGLQRGAGEAGSESFFTAPVMMVSDKIFGKGKAQEKTWKYISKPATVADMAIGEHLQKVPLMEGLFTHKEKIPWGPEKLKLTKEISRPSAIAPLAKVKDIAVPIIVGAGLTKGVNSIRDKIKERTNQNGKGSPSAPTTPPQEMPHNLNENLEKKGHEMHSPESFWDYGKYLEQESQRVSLFQNDNVKVAASDQAVELATDFAKLGELDDSPDERQAQDPVSTFMAEVLGSVP
jgi:hypothetical protein